MIKKMKLQQFAYIAILSLAFSYGAVAAPVDVADPVAYDSRVELPKAEKQGPVVITSDYEEDETVVYTEK